MKNVDTGPPGAVHRISGSTLPNRRQEATGSPSDEAKSPEINNIKRKGPRTSRANRCPIRDWTAPVATPSRPPHPRFPVTTRTSFFDTVVKPDNNEAEPSKQSQVGGENFSSMYIYVSKLIAHMLYVKPK